MVRLNWENTKAPNALELDFVLDASPHPVKSRVHFISIINSITYPNQLRLIHVRTPSLLGWQPMKSFIEIFIMMVGIVCVLVAVWLMRVLLLHIQFTFASFSFEFLNIHTYKPIYTYSLTIFITKYSRLNADLMLTLT